jgi:(p)ppGpp synthase/HD superfamily hydrolase
MHQVAEYGMASHWAYKDGQRRKLSDDDQSMSELYNTPWLSSIKEWQNDKLSSRDFVDSVRRELLGKRVFVFLRNGKILNLARGATAIDAAFQIHTEVGLKMHGVEVNGKPVPLSYELRNGDVVSILTGQGKPATDWMRYAKSRSTRSKLRSYFRAKQRESLREAGKILLMDFLWIHADLIQKASYLEEDFRVPTLNVAEIQQFLPGRSQYEEVDDLLIALGKEHSREMLHKVVSQIFEVPKKVLMEAEEKRRSSRSGPMMDAVLEGRRRAQDVASKLTNDMSLEKRNGTYTDMASSSTIDTARNLSPQFTMENLVKNANARPEYADHEHLCKEW